MKEIITGKISTDIKESDKYRDKIRGSIFGGAVGDALGYPIEFLDEKQIFGYYGPEGIQDYLTYTVSHTAHISDDTQMTLFTANGILLAETRMKLKGVDAIPHKYVRLCYQDWLRTQTISYMEYIQGRELLGDDEYPQYAWLADVEDLYHRRAPGNTCMTALIEHPAGGSVDNPINRSKGCGGIMRVAPMGLKRYDGIRLEAIDLEGAEISALTHGHSLGYMPAAMLTHILHQIVYGPKEMTLREIIWEAQIIISDIFADDPHLKELNDIIDLAEELVENDKCDLDNIHLLGKGAVAEETLAIALYCALRHQDDFSAGVIAAVNHDGDSDSTGAVTGNILGAMLGYEAIESKWKKDLELADVILEIADDLNQGCLMEKTTDYNDPDWERKYVRHRWK